MPNSNFLKDLSEEQNNLGLRIFDLIFARVLKSAYFDLNQSEKKDMENIFLSENDKEKEIFIKKYIPNFKTLFNKEAKEIEIEIKNEIEKQILEN